MNPQKLAGQCAKLKCCLNFEVDTYMEASKRLPPSDVPLETQDATFYHFKTDTLAGMMTYSTDKRQAVNCVTLPASRVAEIIAINKRGEKVEALLIDNGQKVERKEFVELVGQDNINRFDKAKKKKKKRGGDKQNSAQQPAKEKQQKAQTQGKQQDKSKNKQMQKGAQDPQNQGEPRQQQKSKNNRKKSDGPKSNDAPQG